jgi:hypothetical protein
MQKNNNKTVVPFLTNKGDLPSGPPPTGSTVSLIAWRTTPGTAGFSRRAEHKQSAFGLGAGLWGQQTFFDAILEVSHALELFEAGQRSIKRCHFSAQFRPNLWPLRKVVEQIT